MCEFMGIPSNYFSELSILICACRTSCYKCSTVIQACLAARARECFEPARPVDELLELAGVAQTPAERGQSSLLENTASFPLPQRQLSALAQAHGMYRSRNCSQVRGKGPGPKPLGRGSSTLPQLVFSRLQLGSSIPDGKLLSGARRGSLLEQNGGSLGSFRRKNASVLSRAFARGNRRDEVNGIT